MNTYPGIKAEDAHALLTRFDFSQFRKYVANVEEGFNHRDFVAALSAWLVWISANRYLPNSRLPMALPYGPVANLHYLLARYDTYFLNRLYNTGAGTVLYTVTVTDENRGIFSQYEPLEATELRIKEAGLPLAKVTDHWRSDSSPTGKLALVTATREQAYRSEGNWRKLFETMAARC